MGATIVVQEREKKKFSWPRRPCRCRSCERSPGTYCPARRPTTQYLLYFLAFSFLLSLLLLFSLSSALFSLFASTTYSFRLRNHVHDTIFTLVFSNLSSFQLFSRSLVLPCRSIVESIFEPPSIHRFFSFRHFKLHSVLI